MINEADIRALRPRDEVPLELVIRKSSIKHPDTGIGVYGPLAFKKDERIGWYYGILVYGDIGANRRQYKTYGTGILAITSNYFDKWAIQLHNTFVGIRKQKNNGCVVGAKCCVCR